jgi:cytoskeletal protein CcmA (bactofilin family)
MFTICIKKTSPEYRHLQPWGNSAQGATPMTTKNQYAAILICVLLLLLFPMSFAIAQYSGENVNISGRQEQNIYAAGSNVLVAADADADVVVAGGQVTIADKVAGDVLAAGGTVEVQAQTGGDVRIAGGQLTIDGPVGGDAVAAGGDVTLSPQTVVNGRAWLAGGEINMDARLKNALSAAGGVINISGQVLGDVELRGEHINILPGASIEGQLNYYSPTQATIDPKAHIGGKITYHLIKSERPSAAVIVGVALVAFISLLLAGIVLYLLFPRLSFSAIKAIHIETGKSIALGLALFITVPFTAIVLFSTFIGGTLAIILLAVYFVFMISSYLILALFTGDIVMRLVRFSPENSKGMAIAALTVGLLILFVVLLIPFLGFLVEFIATLFALGALSLKSFEAHGRLRGESSP